MYVCIKQASKHHDSGKEGRDVQGEEEEGGDRTLQGEENELVVSEDDDSVGSRDESVGEEDESVRIGKVFGVTEGRLGGRRGE